MSGAPVDIAERECREQDPGEGDDQLADRAVELDEGQRQEQEQRRGLGADDDQCSEVERASEYGVERIVGRVGAAEVADREHQQQNGDEREEVGESGRESAGDDAEEGDGQAGVGGVEVVVYGKVSCARACDDDQQAGEGLGPLRKCGLEALQELAGQP